MLEKSRIIMMLIFSMKSPTLSSILLIEEKGMVGRRWIYYVRQQRTTVF